MMYTLWQSKKMIKKLVNNVLLLLQHSHMYVRDNHKYVCTGREVNEETVNRSGVFGLEIPVSYHFYGHEEGV